MKKLRRRMVREISGYICDRCGRQAELGEMKDMEAEEFISIERIGAIAQFLGMAIRYQLISASIALSMF